MYKTVPPDTTRNVWHPTGAGAPLPRFNNQFALLPAGSFVILRLGHENHDGAQYVYATVDKVSGPAENIRYELTTQDGTNVINVHPRLLTLQLPYAPEAPAELKQTLDGRPPKLYADGARVIVTIASNTYVGATISSSRVDETNYRLYDIVTQDGVRAQVYEHRVTDQPAYRPSTYSTDKLQATQVVETSLDPAVTEGSELA